LVTVGDDGLVIKVGPSKPALLWIRDLVEQIPATRDRI